MNTATVNTTVFNGFLTELPYVGPNAEKSFFAESGVNNWYPYVRGTSFVIVVENKNPGTEWAVEGLTAKVRDAGRRR